MSISHCCKSINHKNVMINIIVTDYSVWVSVDPWEAYCPRPGQPPSSWVCGPRTSFVRLQRRWRLSTPTKEQVGRATPRSCGADAQDRQPSPPPHSSGWSKLRGAGKQTLPLQWGELQKQETQGMDAETHQELRSWMPSTATARGRNCLSCRSHRQGSRKVQW